MGKTRLYGLKSTFIPNAQADRRHRQKIFNHRSDVVDRLQSGELQERRQMKEQERRKAELYANGSVRELCLQETPG